MAMNWVDLSSLLVVAVAASVQFLRGTRDFSATVYELVLLIGAVFLANRLYEPASLALRLPPVVCFAGIFVVLAVAAFVLGWLLNRFAAWSMGGFNYLFALLIGVASGWAIGHAYLKSLHIALYDNNEAFRHVIARSWVASQLLYFGAAKELLVILRIARYHNVAN